MKRLWWEQSDVYWELPFYAEMGHNPPLPRDNELKDHNGCSFRDDELAGREQLWAMREGLTEIEIN